MAKRLNKQLVLILTVTGMAVVAAAGVVGVLKLPKRDPQPLIEEARKLIETKEASAEGAVREDYERARRLYRRAANRARVRKEHALTSECLLKEGDMAMKGGAPALAREAWQRVMAHDPGNESAQQKLLELDLEFAGYHGGQMWNQSEQDARRLLEINPANAFGMNALGLALIMQRGENEQLKVEGLQHLKDAVEADPDNPKFSIDLANYYFSEKQRDKALEVLNTIIEDHPPADKAKLAEAFLTRGVLHVRMREEHRRDHQQQMSRGSASRVETLQKQFSEADTNALRDLERATELNPKNINAWLELGNYWRTKAPLAGAAEDGEQDRSQYLEKAEKCFKTAILDVDSLDYGAYLLLSQLYASQSEFDKALDVIQKRLDRGYDRNHYRATIGIDPTAMNQLRESAFKINQIKLQAVVGDTLDNRKEREALISELERLHNEAISESMDPHRDPNVRYMAGRLKVIEGDNLGAIKELLEASQLLEGRQTQTLYEVNRMLASLYVDTGSPGLAKERAYKVLMYNPVDAVTLSILARAHLASYTGDQDEELEKARQAASSALEARPELVDARQVLAEVYRLQGRTDLYEKVIAELNAGADPLNVKTREAYQLLMRAQHDEPELYPQIEQMLAEVVDEDPTRIQAVRGLIGIMQRDENRYPDIETLLKKSRDACEKEIRKLADRPEDDPERRRLRLTMTAVEQYAVMSDPNITAEERFQRMESVIKQIDDTYDRAVELYRLYASKEEHHQKALQQLKEAHKAKPDDKGVIELLFRFALRLKDWETAESCIQLARRTGLDPSGGHFYRGQFLLAQSDDDPGKAQAARTEIQAGLVEFPNDPRGHIWMGETLMQLKLYAQAAESFERAQKMNPRSQRAAVGLAMTADRVGNEEDLERYLKLCQDLNVTHQWLDAKMREREYRTNPRLGIRDLEAVREKEPENLGNLLMLADLYRRDGQTDKAKEIYETCLRIKPDGLGIAKAYSQFLRDKENPEPQVAEEMLRDLVKRVHDPEDDRVKAAAQLLLAEHLSEVALKRGAAATPEEWAAVSDAFEESARLSDAVEVRIDIGNYYRVRNNFDQAERWFREALAKAISRNDKQAQRTPRLLLIDTLLAARDTERLDEIQKQIQEYREWFPNDSAAELYQGMAHSIAGQDIRAMQSFRKYVEREPDEAVGYYHIGLIHFRSSRWADAAAELRQVKRLNPSFNNYNARIILARALDADGQPDAAIQELQEILADKPTQWKALDEILQLYARLKRWDSAKSLLEPRRESDPDDPLWPQLLARVATEQGDGENAIRFSRESAEKSDLIPETVKFFLYTSLRFRGYDEVIQFISERLPEEKRFDVTRLLLAQAYAGKLDAERSLKLYIDVFKTEQLSLDDYNRSLKESLGMKKDVAPGLHPDDAKQVLRAILAENPKEYLAKYVLALIHRRTGENPAYIQALRDLAQEIPPEEKSTYLLVLRELALAVHEESRLPESRELYEKILELDPDEVVSLNNLSFMLTENLGQPQKGLEYALRAAKLMPDNAGILDTLGWAYAKLGRHSEAIATLRRAIELSHRVPSFHYHVAEALYARSQEPDAQNPEGDLEEARREVQQAYRLLGEYQHDPQGILKPTRELATKLGLRLR